MKPVDYAKALGLAVLVLALNLLLTTVVITVYALVVEPGQPQAHYTAMAPKIGQWSAPIGGALLFGLAGGLLARRRPDRNGLAFIVAAWAAYIVVDLAAGLAMGAGAPELLTWQMAVSMLAALGGGVAGALVGRGAGRTALA